MGTRKAIFRQRGSPDGAIGVGKGESPPQHPEQECSDHYGTGTQIGATTDGDITSSDCVP
jgi:hypothetical protein